MAESEWVLLAYRVPREPSTPRIAIWRKLRKLGVAQLGDGLVALPHDPATKEHLEWVAEDVVEAGGEATIWIARPGTRAQEREIVAVMAAEVEAEYEAVLEEARAAIQDEAPGPRKRTAARLRREVKRIRQRDYFPKRGYERALAALDKLDASVERDHAQEQEPAR